MEADSNRQYSNYYIWAPFKPGDLTDQEASRWVEANAPRDKYYIKNHYDVQPPPLNYRIRSSRSAVAPTGTTRFDAPGPMAVQQRELQNIIRFWLEKGIDGFRVDLAASLVKNDPDKKATIALWKGIEWLVFCEKFTEGILIAEWFNPKQSIESGFDIDFLRPGKIYSPYERGQKTNVTVYFDRRGLGTDSDWVAYFKDQYENTLNKGYVSLPTGNHDSPRMSNEDRKDSVSLKVLLTFLLTQPGVPFIYYGDEIGMKYIPNSPDVEAIKGQPSRYAYSSIKLGRQSKCGIFYSCERKIIYTRRSGSESKPYCCCPG